MNLEVELLRDSHEAQNRAPGDYDSYEPNKLHEAVHAAALSGTLQQLIDDLPEQIALLNGDCTILAVNHAWREIVERHGYVQATPGGNYRDFCALSASEGYEPAREALTALEDILSGKRAFWQLFYNGRERWGGRDFQICMHRIAAGTDKLILVTRFDLTEIQELRRIKDERSHSIIEQQAIERQRIARELHDSTSQLLTAMGLFLGRLEGQSPNEQAKEAVEELQLLVREVQQEIRSISYLAHPPSLEKLGLADAMKTLVEGFARRAALEASFEIHGVECTLPSAACGTIYRVAQEALSNIQRHARAGRVRLLLCFRRSAVHVVIADDGVGISPSAIAGRGSGVGLASMRARLSEVAGRLTVSRLSPGTAIIATVRQD